MIAALATAAALVVGYIIDERRGGSFKPRTHAQTRDLTLRLHVK